MRLIMALVVGGILASCATLTAEQFANDPQKRMVNIDDHHISVVPLGGRGYVAWGGGWDTARVMRYRQKRAIELVSGCRVGEGMSQPSGEVLQATVSC